MNLMVLFLIKIIKILKIDPNFILYNATKLVFELEKKALKAQKKNQRQLKRISERRIADIKKVKSTY